VASEFTTSVQVYDALGQSHVMTITYTNTASRAWNVTFRVPAADVVGGGDVVGGVVQSYKTVAIGALTFDTQGQLETVTMTAPASGGGSSAAVPPTLTDVTFGTLTAWTDGAAVNTIVWDILDASRVGSLTGFRSTSATSSITQNGNGSGMINSISISPDGTIVAAFGSGETVSVGQIAMASFNNPKGLVKLGSNRYGESESAGLPNIGVAGSGGRGTLIGSALEQSNVDIAQEFTRMILAQRGYQANSKTITVSDELMQETLNLKR
jgi:flagellar hook protein FlgE